MNPFQYLLACIAAKLNHGLLHKVDFSQEEIVLHTILISHNIEIHTYPYVIFM